MALYKQNGSEFWWFDFTVDGKRYRGSTRLTRKTAALSMEAELRVRAKERGPNFVPQRRAMTLRELAPRFLEWKGGAPVGAENADLLRSRMETSRPDFVAPGADHAYNARFSRRNALCQERRKGVLSEVCKPSDLHAKADVEQGARMAPDQRGSGTQARKSYGRFRIISREEEANLLLHASQPLRDIVVVAMDTGMRPNEIFMMRWENVFWDAQEYFVAKSKTDAGRRRIPLSSRILEALLARWSGEQEGFVFGTRSKAGHITTVKTAFRTARTKAGLDDRIVLYSARHTFGTFATAATKNLPMVMQTMGHANVRSTLPYQHHGFDGIRAVIEQRNRDR